MTRRICAYRVEGEKSERVPSGGSRTMTSPTCNGVVGVSSDRNAASSPSRGFMSRCDRSRRTPAPPHPGRRRPPGRTPLPRPHDDQLGDPVPPAHGVVLHRVMVDQNHLELAPVAGVDQPRRVEAGHAVAQRQTAAGQDEPGVPLRDGHRDSRRHQRPAAPGRQHDGLAGHQVRSGIAGSGVRGHPQVGVELMQGHAQHRWTLQGRSLLSCHRPDGDR